MKILWFPRLQVDIDNLSITTWREMCRELEETWKCDVRIAIAGNPCASIFDRNYIPIFVIRKKFLRIITFWIFGYIKFIYHCLTFKPDVVILDIFTIWFSIPFSLLPKKRTLFIVDNRTPFYDMTPGKRTWEDKIAQFYTALSYKYCKGFLDGMTVITDHYKEYVCGCFGFEPSSIGVWSSGVNIGMFSPDKVKPGPIPGFLKDKFVLMYHGGIGYNRGLLETVDAIKLVDKEEIVLFFVGDGQASNEISRKIKSLDLGKKMYILPAIPYSEIPVYISYCDCAIMAYPDIEYWNNNNPLKLLEYLAMGKPVICTDILTFRSVAGNNKCLYYIKQNDKEKIAEAINYCYKNKEHLRVWGGQGVEIVKKGYTWHKQSEKLLHFIGNLREKRKK